MLFDIQCVRLGYRLILCHLYIFRVYSHDHLECNSIRLHFFQQNNPTPQKKTTRLFIAWGKKCSPRTMNYEL